MKLLIEIPDEEYRRIIEEQDIPCRLDMTKAIKNGKPFDSVLDEMKAKVEDESYLSYDENPRHVLDEAQVLDIIDKYRESEE